ncbi:glycosyltransferase family 2 protein [Roseimarinus sediminis]|uniref:glycosyltransferase n=1 Tax=Roseimarinus sediminis TaxID=1610899 RepID=UPI003D23F420
MRKMAVLIPGYKEDAVIVDVANDALNQKYPKELFDVVVIADSFRQETIDALKALSIILVEVSFEKSTKSKALNKAMETIGNNFDVAVVLDADNLMMNDFLLKINHAFNCGFKVVQGHRVAKNLNTHFAVLDAISEEVNNHIFRKGHRNLGLSSALIGSGMAFDYHLFKTTMANVNAIGGFDKELELKLLRDNIKIEFLNNALVLDEKVQKPDVFANQRKRWLSAQFIYFRRYFFSGLKHLIVRGNVDFFDKVFQMVSPPRVLLLGLTTLFAMVFGFLALLPGAQDILALQFTTWLALAILVYVSFVLAVPISFYTQKTLIAFFSLPKAFILMFLSLFKLKGANKKFIHTAHGVEK